MRIPFRSENARSIEFLHAATSSEHALSRDHALDSVSQERHCGPCHACCVHLPIPAGEVCLNAKPAGVMCPNLSDHGCQAYSSRPETCRQFQCVWLAEPSWPDAWRPENSGLLCLREEIENEVSAALVYEIARDALASPTAEAILASLTESTAVVAVVNLQRQRRLLRGHQWIDESAHQVRRPHFLKPIHQIQSTSQVPFRDAS